ncbi:MAG: efflux RND transporter periplasmic adaptor subunit [Planctomycetota bacterium]
MTIGRIIGMIVVALAVLMGGGMAMNVLASMRQAPTIKPPDVVRGPLVQVLDVTTSNDRFVVRSQGNVRPPRESAVVPQVAGRVTKVADSLAVGGYFRPNEPLIWLDTADFQQAVANARLAQAQASTRLSQEQAEANVAREEWKRMGRTGDPPDLAVRAPQLAEAQAALDAASEAVKKAERDLTRAVVLAPDYRGRVQSVMVNVGQYITPVAPVAQVYSVEAAEVRLPLSLDDLAYVDLPLWPDAPDATDAASNDAHPAVTLRATIGGHEWTWTGQIVRTEGRVDPRTRWLYAIARVENPLGGDPAQPKRPPLMLDLFVEAEMAGKQTGHVVRLPREAVHGENTVHVVEAGKLAFRKVEVLRRTLDEMVVRAYSGSLNTGDRVVITPLPAPVEGMLLRVAGQDDATDETTSSNATSNATTRGATRGGSR